MLHTLKSYLLSKHLNNESTRIKVYIIIINHKNNNNNLYLNI